MGRLSLDIAGLNAVLKTALDAVVVMDLAGVVRGWNVVAERTFGLPADAAIGRRMSETIIPHRYREAHERGFTQFLDTFSGPVLDTMIEIEALCTDGREIPIELSITFTEHFGEPLFLGFLRDVSERRESERQRQLLIGELNHRVKNLLGVVSGIATQTLRNSLSLEDFAGDFTGRLSALARSHEMLTAESWQQGSLADLLEVLIHPLADGERVSLTGPAVTLSSRNFLAVSMVVHELLTNAVKYGALSEDAGRLSIAWREEEDEDGAALVLIWRETGREHPPQPPEQQGFGMRMIEFSARHDLGGAAFWNWKDEGLEFEMRFKPQALTGSRGTA